MNHNLMLGRLEQGLRTLAAMALALLLFQLVGVLTYLLTVWPQMASPPPAVVGAGAVAVTAALVRSALWVRIYWTGAKVVSTHRTGGASTDLPGRLVPIVGTLTKLLVGSCILDVLLLPAIFLMDVFFPFKLSSTHLGLIQVASLIIPQAFGIGALVLAYLAHQYGALMRERCQMKEELELTV